jgi:hypothetical protein
MFVFSKRASVYSIGVEEDEIGRAAIAALT